MRERAELAMGYLIDGGYIVRYGLSVRDNGGEGTKRGQCGSYVASGRREDGFTGVAKPGEK